jgi:hypothetical protein
MKSKFLLLTLTISILIMNLVRAQNGISDKFSRRNKDILSLNAIVADKSYYSQAILEYQIVKKLIDRYSVTNKVIESSNGKIDEFKNVVILGNIDPSDFDYLGVKPCNYRLPEKIEDLKSGFQFRHYLFKGENKTALEAFGIINNEFSKEDLYVVIDYIQYQDCGCDALPKIRYAVGIRSEFKISGMNLNEDKNKDSEVKNLNIEKLAANVEFGRLKVDISMKTIGITGKLARLNIPTNTSFNVQTYGEYTKVIDFIRNSIDQSSDTTAIFIQPEIIPVMDEYRTSISEINTAYFDELFEIKKRHKKYSKKLKESEDDKMGSKIDSILKLSLYQEVVEKNWNREQLTNIDRLMKNLKKYEKILLFVSKPAEFESNKNANLESPSSTSEIYKSLRDKYNDAIILIYEGKKSDAINRLQEIRTQKHNYGNAYEILNLLSIETDDKKIFSKIINEYTWLIDIETLNKLKTKL